MRVLNIIRTKPDDTTKTLVEGFSTDEGAKQVLLYEENFDWHALVDDIFSYEKIICWW
jgi:hypothetical protein